MSKTQNLLGGMLAFSIASLTQAALPRNTELDVSLTRTPVQLVSNIVFAQPAIRGFDNFNLKMDVLRPQAGKPLPAVIFVTGGGFINANKDSYIQQRMDIANAGYVVASVEYRVVPTATFPAPVVDVKSAIRYLRANAQKYGIDPQHIAIFGESAGGYFSAFVGVSNGLKEFDQGANLEQSSAVQAVIDLYGLSDLTLVGEGFPEDIQARHASPSAPEAMLVNGTAVFGDGGAITRNPEKAAAANPITYITSNTPPFLLMHGDQDTTVSPRQTERLHAALLAKGVDSTRYVVKGAAHNGPYWAQAKVMQIIIDFLDRTLKK